MDRKGKANGTIDLTLGIHLNKKIVPAFKMLLLSILSVVVFIAIPYKFAQARNCTGNVFLTAMLWRQHC